MSFTSQVLLANHCHIEGRVRGLELHSDYQDTILLYGAELFWMNSTVGTTTDKEGHFHLGKSELDKPLHLIVRYVSYDPDTLYVDANQVRLDVLLTRMLTTHHVVIEAEESHRLDHMETIVNTQTLTQSGLRSLACCNLSESFESTAAVDVEYADAVSGAKYIRMLGLAGYYTQILVEKNPLLNGLISPNALEIIPGAWMQSIDISKGISSVTTGYESITGQINVELLKPERNDPLTLNLYQNSMGRTEGSLSGNKGISPGLSTMLLLYGMRSRMQLDENRDTFLDMPMMTQLNIMNRWSYETESSHVQLGLSYIRDHRDGGQEEFNYKNHQASDQFYGYHNQTDRIQGFLKAGFTLDSKKTSSLGLTISGFFHDQDSYWGIKSYQATQKNSYINLMYIKSGAHFRLDAGISWMMNRLAEDLSYVQKYTQHESVPGTYLELTLMNNSQWTAMAGIRYDRHNVYGTLLTPRFHIKFAPGPLMAIRISAGRGFTNPSIIAENPVILASSKNVVFKEKTEIEKAWNAGIQWSYTIAVHQDHPISMVFDFFRTEFQNQIIVDQEREVDHIIIYNLSGRSYSNSYQTEMNASLFKGLGMSLAWKWNDVKTTYSEHLLEKPLINRYKGMLVLSYMIRSWQIDFTTQFNGKARLPQNESTPDIYRKKTYSPSYFMLFSQIKKKFPGWEIYLGMENMTHFVQKDPVLAWQEPFGPYFDSTVIWGPVIGRRIYFGIRFE